MSSISCSFCGHDLVVSIFLPRSPDFSGQRISKENPERESRTMKNYASFAGLAILTFVASQVVWAANSVDAAKTEQAVALLKSAVAAKVSALPPLSADEIDAPPNILRIPGHIAALRDHPDAPEMIIIPAGEFTMGAEPEAAPAAASSSHLPVGGGLTGRKRIRIGYAFAFSKYPITVGQFAKFVSETHYDAGDVCQVTEEGPTKGHNWRNPGFSQTDNDPVVCVNYDDSVAYLEWLSKKTGQKYRLPSDSEYEYVNRAGTSTRYWWGDAIGKGHATCGGCGTKWDEKQPAPVGSFPANPFGVHDTTGNVWSRTRDCWNAELQNTPADGSPSLTGDCAKRVFRAGGFRSNPLNLRSALRHSTGQERRFNDDGFHAVRVL